VAGETSVETGLASSGQRTAEDGSEHGKNLQMSREKRAEHSTLPCGAVESSNRTNILPIMLGGWLGGRNGAGFESLAGGESCNDFDDKNDGEDCNDCEAKESSESVVRIETIVNDFL
jgi:hypothetical protein